MDTKGLIVACTQIEITTEFEIIIKITSEFALRLRGKTEDDAWWKEVGAIAPKVKEQMILEVKEI